MPKAANLDALHAERYAAAIRAAGNPRDQIERLSLAGIVLQARQLRASAAARLCDLPGGPKEIGYGGARAGGKSHWAIAQLADDCLRRPGLKCLLLRKVGKANRENFEDLRLKVLPGVRTRYLTSESKLLFTEAVDDAGNPSQIKIGHFQNPSDIDAYLGLEYDVILIEEATTLDRTRVEDILTCLRTSKPDWRPRAYFTTNPGNIGHAWFKRRFIEPFRAGSETLTRFIPATVDDNAFIDAEYQGKLDSLSGWKLRAWRYGDWDIAAGQYFTTWNHARHVLPRIEFSPEWRAWIALDYGYTHYTAAYLFGECGDGTVYVVDEHAERGWLPSEHAAGIRAMLDRNGVAEHRVECYLAGADVFSKRYDGTTVAEQYAAQGMPLEAANTDRINGAAEFARRLGNIDRSPPIEPTIFFGPRCPQLNECIPNLMHDDRRAEDVKKVDTDEDGFGGDDFYDAARYGLMYAAGGRRFGTMLNPLTGWRG